MNFQQKNILGQTRVSGASSSSERRDPRYEQARGLDFEGGDRLFQFPSQASSSRGERGPSIVQSDSESSSHDSDSDSECEDEVLLPPDQMLCQGEPRIQALTLPGAVELEPGELEAWAEHMGFIVDPGSGRVVDPKALRGELEGYPEDETKLQAHETIIKVDAIRGGKATVVHTSLPLSAFTAIALEIPEMFPSVRALFGHAAKLAPEVMARRQHEHEDANAKLPGYDKLIDGLGPGAKDQVRGMAPGLPQTPLEEGQLERALPVPEGTTGVFHVKKEDTLDVCSAGFVTCMGVVLVGRHPDGSRTVGMTHLNQDIVERVQGSFSALVAQVLGQGASLEVYLVGGGKGGRTSLAMALSLFELVKDLKQSKGIEAVVKGQSLFDGGSAYAFRSTDEGLAMHRAENDDEEATMDDKETLLRDHDDVMRLVKLMTGVYALSPSELIALCNDGEPHPLQGVLGK